MTTLYRGGFVYSPVDPFANAMVVDGTTIAWIGGDDAARVHEDSVDEVVELDGLRLLPGLVDGHVHSTGGGGEGGFASRVPALPLSRYTRGGVTTVVGLLGTDDCVRSPRELLASIYALREEGLSAWAWCGGYHLPPVTLTGSVTDAASAGRTPVG